ncbi:tripartite motif-containing protein 2 [Lingula anatina]|uniref:Tripartite motif-containing protein 2 n=1 Tax=Lingula anatina TaxID=7574 RepID=A0A1S3KB37_LINAN|nr:tripartite motif-containing protein 2 [Lingula anatina]|eukprot:XP_013419853.1 tripartite motif-containing protein 2 [Lingula anatina]
MDVENQLLSCQVCFEQYDHEEHQPKLLPCHHTFCMKCIDGLKTSKGKAKCPTCRQEVGLPPGGATHLQTNFYIMEMEELLMGMTKRQKDQDGCQTHANQPLSFFCSKCETAICRDCTILSHRESEGHVITEVAVMKGNFTKKLQERLTKLRQLMQSEEDILSALQVQLSSLNGLQKMTEADIDTSLDKCCLAIEERRQKMKENLRTQHGHIAAKLKDMIIETEMHYNQLTSTSEQISHTIKKGKLQDLIDTAKQEDANNIEGEDATNCSSKEVTIEYPQFSVKDFDALQEIRGGLNRMGSLRNSKWMPAKVDMEPESATASLESCVKVAIANYEDKPLSCLKVALDILDPFGDKVCSVSTEERGNGNYSFTFRPQISGPHKCRLVFHDQTLKEVPILVQSNNPVMKFGEEGDGPGQLFRPRHVHAVGENYFVLDLNKVQIFDKDGKYVRHFHLAAMEEKKEGQLTGSSDVCVNAAKEEIICPEAYIQSSQLYADRILIFDFDGRLKQVMPICNGEKSGGVCVGTNSQGDIIVSDYCHEKLLIFNKKGDITSTFRGIKRPGTIAIGQDDDIMVCDQERNCVLVLNRHASFKHQIGFEGKGKGQFKSPSGVCTDRHGNIIVGDGRNNRLQVFKYDGTFVSCIESTGDKLHQPLGISTTDDGHVLVADKLNHCIKKYKYM